MSELLPILYKDDALIAINKPSGLLVHRSPIDRHETRFAVQLLREQIGQPVFPLHRLDKPTSGVLLFALSSAIATQIQPQFSSETDCPSSDHCPLNDTIGRVQKRYLAVVRGWAPEVIRVDHAIKDKLDKFQKRSQPPEPKPAITHFRRIATTTTPSCPDGKFDQGRYSLVACQPITGRRHQLRRHLKHLAHPIIGDAKHGKGVHNRYFQEAFNSNRLLLHADQLILKHPVSGARISLEAPITPDIQALFHRFGWEDFSMPALPF